MAVRFSGFATKTGTLHASTKIVGYDDPAGTKENVQFSLATLVANVPNIYNTNGTLTAARTVEMDGNNLTFSSASGHPQINSTKFILYPNGNNNNVNADIFTLSGRINFNYLGHQGQGLFWNSYNTSITGYGLSLYGGGGFTHNSGYSVIGPDYDATSGADLTARLGVIGVHNDNTSYAFRVQNSDLTDMLSVRNDGAIALGLDAANISETNICIGIEAATPSVYGVAIGRKTSIGGTASYATVIGNQASTNSAQSVVVGAYSVVGFKGATLGYGAGSASNYAVNIGNGANGSGASSITLNANSGSAAPSTVNAFGVYMSSSSTPDFRIAHDGDSYITGSGKFGIGRSNITATLDVTHYDAARKLASFSDNTQTEVFSIANNGTVKITGQAYTELHTGAAPADPDWNNGNIQEMTLASSDQDFDPSNAKAGATYILKIKQPSSGVAGTINWSAASATVLWPSPGAPTLSTANNAVDIVTLICTDSTSGGTYYANATLNFS